MNSFIPKRPAPGTDGDTEELRFMQALWDAIWGGGFPVVDTDQCQWSRGQKGYWPKINIQGGGGGGATVEVTICLPDTGTTETYLLKGKLKPTP